MKGIIVAGGAGTRLHPITIGTSKQLLPIYDKPLIYYPLSALMLAGIKEVLILVAPNFLNAFKSLLGDGSQYGISIEYVVQQHPNGIAEALILGEKFLDGEAVCVVLGDNIFYGQGLTPKFREAVKRAEDGGIATIFGYQVSDPSRFGVVSFDGSGQVREIVEKPGNPDSNFAVTGIYFYDNRAVNFAKSLEKSDRGELEITDVNNAYLANGDLFADLLGRGTAWLDTGTYDSLLEASCFIQTLEKRQGFKVACLEEISYRNCWLSKKKLIEVAEQIKSDDYSEYLLALLDV